MSLASSPIKPPGGQSAVPPARFLDDKKALSCIHCGLCLSSCPTYLVTGNENDSPRGRIYLMRAIQDGRLPLEDASVRHLDLCLGCRACEAVCPSGVPYGDLLEHTREHIEANHARSPWQTFLRRIAIEKIFPFPERMEIALIPARLVGWLGVKKWLPGPLQDALSLVPADISRADLPVNSPSASDATKRGKVGFINGCVMSVMFGQTHRNSVQLLNQLGYEVATPPNQPCCGALFAHGGDLAGARGLARKNIEIFERQDCDLIVINAAGCGSTLKEYGHLLEADPLWAERGRRFSAKVKDLSEVLASVLPTSTTCATKSEAIGVLRVTCHDACHLAHAQRITAPPRRLVQSIARENYVELAEADVCCGSAGSYNLTEPEMAGRLQDRKIQNILDSKADIVVTTNPGCLLQMQAGLTKAGANRVRAMHLADFLVEFGGRVNTAAK